MYNAESPDSPRYFRGVDDTLKTIDRWGTLRIDSLPLYSALFLLAIGMTSVCSP